MMISTPFVRGVLRCALVDLEHKVAEDRHDDKAGAQAVQRVDKVLIVLDDENYGNGVRVIGRVTFTTEHEDRLTGVTHHVEGLEKGHQLVLMRYHQVLCEVR